jgi:hypothetical protein
VIVDVRLLAVVPLLVIAAVIMAMGDRRVVVVVCMPEGAVLPLAERAADAAAVVMGNVVVIVRVDLCGVRVLGLAALALGSLRR